MPTINLGRVGFVQKGTYNSSTPYKVNDVVTDDGQVFACIVANTGEALTDTIYWSPWVSVQGIINDTVPLETKAYSGYKTQQLHDSQAEALANLASASGKIQNEATPVFNGIPLVLTDMPFDIATDSTDTEVIEFNNAANTITFKVDASYNFISTVEFESSTNSQRTINFALINTSNGSVVTQETATLETESGDIEIIPFNTLLTLGKNGMPSAPLTIKLQAIASGTGYKLNRFSSILASSNAYESSTTEASQVVFTPYGSIEATTVQIALQELDDEKASDTDVIHTTGDETKAGVLTFTSIPKAPTATPGTNTTSLATTAFVKAAIEAIPAPVIPVIPDATNLVKGIDYKGLLAEYEVTGSARTSIDFSGLDINTHKSYRIEIELYVASVAPAIYCFVNNDTTITNYYFQIWGGNAAAFTGARANNPTVQSIGIAGNHACNLNCVRSNGTPIFTGIYSSQLGTTLIGYNVLMYKTSTVTNITQLTFTSSVTNAIGIGSKIRIYRGDV